MRFSEYEAGLIHMAFAFKQEVSTGKGGKPLCFSSSHALVIQTKTYANLLCFSPLENSQT